MKRLGQRLFATWGYAASLPLGLLVGLIGILPFWPIPRGRRERYTIRGAQLWARLVVRFVLLVKVRFKGERLPEDRGCIVLCNHRSWLDPLLLLGWTRSNGLSKREILYIPVIGFFGWLAGAVFFDRRDRSARARARAEVITLVRSGHRVQVFPEGTRSRDGKLAKRVFLALVRDAYNANVPVVPCAVMGTENVLPPSSFGANPFQTVDLHVGSVLEPGDFSSEEDYAIAAWTAVKALIEQMPGAGVEPAIP